MGLIDAVVEELGVDEAKAKGGVGAILKLLREEVSTAEFSEVEAAVADAGKLADDAPEAEGLAGVLGGLGKALGGDAADVGTLARLAGIFKSLGLDADDVAKFVKAVIAFLQSENADKVVALIKRVFT
jgi:hypothetical protein